MADGRIRTVVMVANYARYAPDTPAMLEGMSHAATALAQAGKELVVVYPIPAMPSDAPRALGLIRGLYWDSTENKFEEQLDLEYRTQRVAGATQDFREGVAAFLEKRAARFRGA